MRTVGARFVDDRAFESSRELRARHGLDDEQVEVHGLGSTNNGELPRDLILAGRFDDAIRADVVAVIERHGGQILVDREEPATEPEAQIQLDSAPTGGGLWTADSDHDPRRAPNPRFRRPAGSPWSPIEAILRGFRR